MIAICELEAVAVSAEERGVEPMTFERAESLTMYGILEGVMPTAKKHEVQKTKYDSKKNEEKNRKAAIVTEQGKVPAKPEKWKTK